MFKFRNIGTAVLIGCAGLIWTIGFTVMGSTLSTRFACSVETDTCSNQASSWLRENISTPANAAMAKAWVWIDPHGAEAITEVVLRQRVIAGCEGKYGNNDAAGFTACVTGKVGLDTIGSAFSHLQGIAAQPDYGWVTCPRKTDGDLLWSKDCSREPEAVKPLDDAELIQAYTKARIERIDHERALLVIHQQCQTEDGRLTASVDAYGMPGHDDKVCDFITAELAKLGEGK